MARKKEARWWNSLVKKDRSRGLCCSLSDLYGWGWTFLMGFVWGASRVCVCVGTSPASSESLRSFSLHQYLIGNISCSSSSAEFACAFTANGVACSKTVIHVCRVVCVCKVTSKGCYYCYPTKHNSVLFIIPLVIFTINSAIVCKINRICIWFKSWSNSWPPL